jgi:hypothetical protein
MSDDLEDIKLNGASFDKNPPELEYEETPIVVKRGRGRPKGSLGRKKEPEEQKRLNSPSRFLEELDEVEDKPQDDTKILDKSKLIKKITSYKALFPDDLKNIKCSNLDNLSQEKLQDKLITVQSLVESRKSLNSTRSVFLVGLNQFENFDYVFNLKLNGLTYTASQNEELMLCVDEVAIKYVNDYFGGSSDPFIRLLFGLSGLVFAIDAKNKGAIQQQEQKE